MKESCERNTFTSDHKTNTGRIFDQVIFLGLTFISFTE